MAETELKPGQLHKYIGRWAERPATATENGNFSLLRSDITTIQLQRWPGKAKCVLTRLALLTWPAEMGLAEDRFQDPRSVVPSHSPLFLQLGPVDGVESDWLSD